MDKFLAKDAVYRFLNQSTFNWRRFLLLLSTFTVQKVARLTNEKRPNIPIDFSLLSSKKAQINGISEEIDKHTCGYKRRQNTLQTVPEQIPDMIKRAIANGVDACYVLMDS